VGIVTKTKKIALTITLSALFLGVAGAAIGPYLFHQHLINACVSETDKTSSSCLRLATEAAREGDMLKAMAWHLKYCEQQPTAEDCKSPTPEYHPPAESDYMRTVRHNREIGIHLKPQ